MGEFYGAAWVKQYGENGGSGWETWCKALSAMSLEEITKGVERIFREMPKYPPNLPQFCEMCGEDVERAHKLEGEEVSYMFLSSFASKPPKFGENKDLSPLTPVMYWIYKNIDLYNWKRMQTKDARQQFGRVYRIAVQKAKDGFEFPEVPVMIESPDIVENRLHRESMKNPAYVSKRKAAGIAALAAMRAGYK